MSRHVGKELARLTQAGMGRDLTHRPSRFASRRCAISSLYSLGQKNHNMHHRTSTESICMSSMCDILFCILLARKITTCIIAHRPTHSDRVDSPVDVRYIVLHSLGQKNHNMHHRTSTESISQSSMCDILFCILLARKITTCIIAHRPSRFACRRCAISWFVFYWPEKSQHAHCGEQKFALSGLG